MRRLLLLVCLDSLTPFPVFGNAGALSYRDIRGTGAVSGDGVCEGEVANWVRSEYEGDFVAVVYLSAFEAEE